MSDNKPWSELGSLKDLVVPRSEMNLPGFEGHFDGPPPERCLRNSVRPPDGDSFGNENVMPNPSPSPGPNPGPNPGPGPGPARSMNPFAAHGGAHTRGGFQPMAEPPPPPPRRFRNSNYSMNRRMQAEGSNYSQFQRSPLMPHGVANAGRAENDDELRSIFLPGLDPATGHREVFEYFCRFGPLERVTVRRGKDDSGYAIVHFRNSGSMRSAIASNPHELRGRKVHCRSADKRDNRYKPKKQNGWNKNRGNQTPQNMTRQNMTRQKNKPPARGRQWPGGNAAGGGPMGGNSAAGASMPVSGNAAGASAAISGNAAGAHPKLMSGNSGGASAPISAPPVPIDPDMPSTSTGIVSSGDRYTRFTRSMTARQASGPSTFAEKPAKPSGVKNPFADNSKPKPSADKPKAGADKSKPPTDKPKPPTDKPKPGPGPGPGPGPKPKPKAKPRKAPRLPVVRLPVRRSERLRKRLLVKPAANAPRPRNPPQSAPPAPANPPQPRQDRPRGENRARRAHRPRLAGGRRRPGATQRRSARRGGGVKKTQRTPRWTMRLGRSFLSEEEKKAYDRGSAPAAAELATPRTLRRSARKKEDSQSANSIKNVGATGERVDEPIGASGAGSGPLASPSQPPPPPPLGFVTPSGSHLVLPHPGHFLPATTPPPPVVAGSSQATSLQMGHSGHPVPPFQVPYPPGSPSPLHQVVAGSSQARSSAGSHQAFPLGNLLGHLFSPSTPPPPVVAGASRARSMASGSPSTKSHLVFPNPGHLIAPYQVPHRSIPGHLMPPPLQATQILAGSSQALSRSLGNVTPPESPQVLASSGHVIPPFFPQTPPPHILNSPTPQTPPNSSPQVDSPPFLQASEAIAPPRVVVPDAVPVIPTWFELLQAINARGGGSPDSFPSSASSNALQIVTSPEQSLPSSPGSVDSLPTSNQVQPSHNSSGSSTSSNSLNSSPIPAGILPHPGLYSQALNVLTSPGTSARPSTSSGPGLLSLSNPNTAAMQPPRNRGSLPQPPQRVAARPAGFYLETLPSESSQDNGPPSRRRRVNDPRLAARLDGRVPHQGQSNPGRRQPPQSVPVRGRPFSIPLPRGPLPHSLHPEPPRGFGSKARFTLNCYTNVEGYRRSRKYVPLSEDEKKKRPTVKEFLEKQYTDEAVFISSEDLRQMHLDARNEFWRQAPNAEKWQNLKRIRQSFVSFAGPTDKESHRDENKIYLPLYTVKLSVQESLEGVRSEGIGIREVSAVLRVLPIHPQHCPIVASPVSGLISSISASTALPADAALGDAIILKKEDPEEEDAKPSVPIPDVSVKKEEMDPPDKVERLDPFVEPILWSPIPARIPKEEDSSSGESDYSIDFSSSEELAEEAWKEESLDLSPKPQEPQEDLLEPEAAEEYFAQLLRNYVSDPGSSDSSDSDDEEDYVSKTSRRPEAYPYYRNLKEEPLEDINDKNRAANNLPKKREAPLQTKLKIEKLMSPEEKPTSPVPIPTTKSNEMEYKTESCHVRPTHGESFKYKGALSYHRLKCHLRRGTAVGTLLFDKQVKILSEKQGDYGAFDKKHYPIDVEDEEKEALEALDDEVIDKAEDLAIEVDEVIDLDSIEDDDVIVIDDDDEVQLEEDLDRKNIEKNRDHRDRDSPDSPEHLSQQTLRSLKEFKNWYDSFAPNEKEIFKKNLRDLLVKMKQETGQDFKPKGSKVKLTLDAESFTEKMVVWAKSVNAEISIKIPKGSAAKGKKYPFQNEIKLKKRISVKATSLTDEIYNWARSLKAEITVEMPSNSFDDFLEGNPLKDNKDPEVFIEEEASQRDKTYPLKNRSHRQHPYQGVQVRPNKLAIKKKASPTKEVLDSSKFLNLKANISKSTDSKDNKDPDKAHHSKNKRKVQSTTNKIAIKKEASPSNEEDSARTLKMVTPRKDRMDPYKKVTPLANKLAIKKELSPSNEVKFNSPFRAKSSDSKKTETKSSYGTLYLKPEERGINYYNLQNRKQVRTPTTLTIKKEPSHKNKVYGSVARFLDVGTTLQIRSDSRDNILKSKAEESGSFGCKPTEEKRAKDTRTKPYQKKPCQDVQEEPSHLAIKKEKKKLDTSKRGALKDIEIEQAIIDGIYTFSISFKNSRRRYKRELTDGEKAGPAKRRKLP
ncbi:serine/arginine repetitive matrix protein 2 isoform X2 [Drosophila ananassae]|uniref:serine/arginine repetitive matrix protein 2 isoform X2 n=1 Tax=Drosophila ananassae TaxID=7217 RepID=UPI0013A5DF5E|nr:serine/arginine repetitive matrix protein 2 isoform X2 [Drosophila ananassae]